MSKLSVEEIKRLSRGLRGRIVETIESGADHFAEEEYQLMKFHGSYQQDDRDLRSERRKQNLDKAWSFMVRSKMPGGRLTAQQYLMHDDLAETVGNQNMRLTTRQGIQLHGILIGSLKEVISQVVHSGLTTWGACGDVVRNTMGPASPIDDVAHRDAQALTEEISRTFLAKSTAYSEIWLDGEKLDLNATEDVKDEIYGTEYLPRKFKIGISIPPRNDVDIFSQDVGMAPIVEGDSVSGYDIWVGGGFGMTHGMEHTRPVLAKPLGFVPRAQVVEAVKAIVAVQKAHGNREDRKLSRLKYLVEKQGIEWFRAEVLKEMGEGASIEDLKPVIFSTVSDSIGWHEQGDGKWFRCVHVPQGRIEDDSQGRRFRSAFRKLAKELGLPSIVTPNANLIWHDIEPGQRDAVDAILTEFGLPNESAFTAARQVGHACVALPTCGLSLAESERVFSGLLDSIDEILRDLGLADEPLLIRMTGCPNGCARPYNADVAFVGRAPKKY
ncbi:MAG: NADPH-dependent assimilatory sulfite reductase hemoprotein subunit, partial [Verrucomicrobiae bacterium]|nr:NADPH-dependent assimilatory sulfite reductase hemoprotein subunit [Verrucomicrobiae bacterium]